MEAIPDPEARLRATGVLFRMREQAVRSELVNSQLRAEVEKQMLRTELARKEQELRDLKLQVERRERQEAVRKALKLQGLLHMRGILGGSSSRPASPPIIVSIWKLTEPFM